MSIKKWLFSQMIFRNMLATFGYRSGYSATPGGFTPYFAYRIESYQQDFYLYFPKEPFAIRYVNEIFNKLYEYEGFDIIRYLEFHYSLYSDKADFLRFLKYEINVEIPRNLITLFRFKLITCFRGKLTTLFRSKLTTTFPRQIDHFV